MCLCCSSAPVPSILFSGTEIVRACSHRVAYSLISSVSTCQVGEHCVLPVTSLPLEEGVFLRLALLPCYPGKEKGEKKRMLHSFLFVPELLCSIFSPSPPHQIKGTCLNLLSTLLTAFKLVKSRKVLTFITKVSAKRWLYSYLKEEFPYL